MKNRINKILLTFAGALFVLALTLVPSIGYGDWLSSITEPFELKGRNMRELVLTREVIIKDESGAIQQPHAILKADDGGFIIAGSINTQAWAIKTDAAGKVLWRFVRDTPPIEQEATFTGAVVMTDGTTYLCGNTSHPPGGYTPSLLAHLNPVGELLEEQLYMPQKRTEHGLSYFDDCIQWGDRLLVIGHILQFSNIKEVGKNSERFYWVLMIDADGKVKWEKQIPTTFTGISSVKSVLATADDSLVFAGDGMVNKTELIRVGANGELMANNLLDGQFQFVHPVNSDGLLQLNGHINDLYLSITLDNHLKEVQRVQGKLASDFFPKRVYRMRDKSLVLFGQGIHSLGARYRSEIAHLDSSLQFATRLELAHAPFSDIGSVNVATPTGNDGEFVAARGLMDQQAAPGSDESRVGMALDFIQIK